MSDSDIYREELLQAAIRRAQLAQAMIAALPAPDNACANHARPSRASFIVRGHAPEF